MAEITHLLCARIIPQRKTDTGTPNSLCSCCSCTSVAHLLAPYLQRAKVESEMAETGSQPPPSSIQ